VLARLVLYYSSHTSSPFVLVIFQVGLTFFGRLAWTLILLLNASHLAGITAQLIGYWLRWGLANFLPWLALNLEFPE
jgi:hypothetical protein